jgi:4-amino-4-deoxy-L-arabinose transferase-like glycosyltransferase
VLAITYSFATPLWEAPDEPSHYLYAEYLATHKSLPPPQPPQQSRFFERGYATSLYEWYQLPLYYMLLAPPLTLVNAVSPASIPQAMPQINPDFTKGAINLFNPTTDRSLESLFEAPGPRVARLFSVLFGLLTLLATYRLALSISPGDKTTALAATGFMAFIPQFTFLTSYVSNDNLAILMSTLCMLTYSELLTQDNPLNWRQLLGMGLLVGLALLTKLSLLFLLPLALLCLLWRTLHHRSITLWLQESLLFTGIAVSLPLLGLLFLPGMHAQLQHANQLLQAKPELMSVRYIIDLWPLTYRSFWGRFGWMNVATPNWIAYIMGMVSFLGLASSLSLFRRTYKHHEAAGLQRQLIILLWLVSGVVLIGFIRFNLSVRQQGRLLFPALPAFVILVALGLVHLPRHRYRWAVGLGLVILALSASLISLFGSLLPAY